MTRLLVIPAFLLVAVVVLTIVGVAGNAPVSMVLGLICGFPMFMLSLGWAIGRASNEFTVVRKPPVEVSSTTSRMRRPDRQEILS